MEINIKQMIDNMPQNLTDIEKIRYIYINFGQLFAYNRDFIYEHLSDKSAKEMYDEPVIIDMNEEGEYQNKLKVTCKQMADSCVQTINNLFSSIIAEVIGNKEDKKHHVAVLVTLNNKHYFMDLHNDLYRIQKGMTTEYFAPSKKALKKEKNNYIPIYESLKGIRCTPIPKEELKNMDKKIGYNRDGIYMDDAMDRLKEEMQDEENWKKFIDDYDNINSSSKKDIIFRWKVDFIFRYIKNNIQNKDKMEEIEIEKFFKKLYYSILTNKEKSDNKIITTHVHVDDKPSVLYKIEAKDSIIYYIYNTEKNGFEKITLEDINEMKNNGKLFYDNKYLNNRQDEWYNRD